VAQLAVKLPPCVGPRPSRPLDTLASPPDTIPVSGAYIQILTVHGAPYINTGVGKSIASAGLVRAAAAAQRVLYLKPVQTGLPHDSDGRLVASLAAGEHSFGAHAAVAAQEGFAPPPASAVHEVSAHTIFGWQKAVSPHLAAVEEGRGVDDASLIKQTRAQLDCFFHGSPHSQSPRIAFVETAGGVASPGPSGTLQCDVLASLHLPGLLIADGRLGGISASICAAESLKARGQHIAAALLIDGGLHNEEKLREALWPSEVFVLPRLKEPHEEHEHLSTDRVSRWLDSSREVWERVLAHLLRQPMLEGYEQDAATGESTVDATVSLPIYKHFLLEKSLCCKASSSCGVLQF
ncbi:MAG: hypothetical protein SGPRY_012185, partial [Prymnesium sp.]